MTGNETSAAKAVVIGAGVAGLATAGLLSRDGYHVVVLEQQPQVGGRAGVLEDDGFRWDMGPSWWLMPEAFEHFYQLMGTSVADELELVELNDPAFRLLTEGYPPLDVSTGSQNIYQLCDALEPGAGAVVERYLAGMERDYRLAIERFLYTNFTQPHKLASPQILGRLGRLLLKFSRSLDGDVGSQVTDTRLRQLLSYAAVFLSSAPKHTPAFYGIMNYTTLIEGVTYPVGGFSTFVDSLHRLAVTAGAEVHTGATVQRILESPGRKPQATGVVYQDATGQHQLQADIVVSCADRHHTETQLLKRKSGAPRRRWKRRNPGMSCVLAYLGVQGSLPELAHHSLVFSKDWQPDFDAVFRQNPGSSSQDRDAFSASMYVCRPSATDPSVAPTGAENVFLLIPTPAMADGIVGNLNDQEDDETTRIVDAAIELLGNRIGVEDLDHRIVKRHIVGPGDFQARFNAWQGNALGLAHTLTQSAFLRGSNVSRDVDGLYFAGSTTAPGVGLPMCLISAENIIKRLRGDASTGPLPTPLQPVAVPPTHNR